MKSSTIAKTLTIAAVTALVLGIGPRAKADGRRCSEANLRGTFAYTSTGFIVAAPIPALVGPYAEVGAQTFVVHKPKELVFENAPASGGAKLLQGGRCRPWKLRI